MTTFSMPCDARDTARREFVAMATGSSSESVQAWRDGERIRRGRHPISRWWICPLAEAIADRLAATRIHPTHVSLLGGALGLTAAVGLAVAPDQPWWAACGVLLAWLCDRVDGPLARRRGVATPRGAWIDACIDEATDVAWHVGAAVGLASQGLSVAPWLLVAFLAGKFLFLHGLWQMPVERELDRGESTGRVPETWLRRAYHAPANADVRLHMLLVAIVTGSLAVELALVAVYYQVRWIVRFFRTPRLLARSAA